MNIQRLAINFLSAPARIFASCSSAAVDEAAAPPRFTGSSLAGGAPSPTPPSPSSAVGGGGMTTRSLDRWSREPGLCPVESQQRQRVAAQIRQRCKSSSADEDAPVWLEGSLVLAGLDALTTLPAGLPVGGTLCIAGCTRLEALPPGLRVRGPLIAEGCVGLASIDPSVELYGDLQLGGCARLTALPETLLRRSTGRVGIWDLRGTGVSQQLGSKLRLLSHVRLDPLPPAAPTQAYTRLIDAHGYWQRACPVDVPACSLPASAPAWLDLSTALQSSSHHQQPQVRPSLALRVLRLLAACDDPEVASETEVEIQRSLAEGDDLVLTLLPRLEEIAAVHRALRSPDPEACLRAEARAGLARSLVAEVAAEHAAGLSGCDDMEVLLAYTAGLADRLPGLTVSCYPSGHLAAVDGACLERAARRVRRGLAAMEASATAAWPPLQRHHREVAARHLDTRRLGTLTLALDRDTVCPITQATAGELRCPLAVVHGGAATVYEKDALLRWWVRHGTDPMKQPLELQALRQVAAPRASGAQ